MKISPHFGYGVFRNPAPAKSASGLELVKSSGLQLVKSAADPVPTREENLRAPEDHVQAAK